MLASARNQFKGKVVAIKKGAVNDEITIRLAGGTELTAIITDTSTKNLGLEVGKEAVALIKAMWVVLATDLSDIKLSARNALKGKVKDIKPGTVNCQVVVDLNGVDEVVAVVTLDSAKKLGLEKGKEVTALVKAPLIIVGVPA